jgi:DNA adenine methylase
VLQDALAAGHGHGMISNSKVKSRLRPAVKWHGGKAYLASRIVSMLPDHDAYVEPFAGGLSVLLNKPRSRLEVAGDVDSGLVEFYTTLRDSSVALIDRLRSIPYTAASFAWALEADGETDPVEAAARFLVRNRFSRGGLGKTFAWSDRLRGGQPGDLNAWETILGELPRIAERLHGVQLDQCDALDLIRHHDGPDTLFYLDPPYLHSTRTARDAYRHELSDQEHSRLLETIVGIRGMVVLSGYRSAVYDQTLRSWERHQFEMPNHSGQGRTKQRRIEVVWLNPACDRFRLGQGRS